jgi:hypothetical protein
VDLGVVDGDPPALVHPAMAAVSSATAAPEATHLAAVIEPPS